MNSVDVIVIIFIVLTGFAGYRRGFIKTLFDTIGLIAAFFISKQFFYIVEDFLLENTKLYVKIHDFFEIQAASFTEILQKSSDEIGEAFREALNLPVELQSFVNSMFSTGAAATGDSFTVFVDNLSVIILRSLSFVITMLTVYVVLVIISNIINAVFKLPVLNLTNRVFGAATGVIKSILILYIVFALLSPVIGFMQDNRIADSIVNSESGRIFYQNNIILNYLSYLGFYEK